VWQPYALKLDYGPHRKAVMPSSFDPFPNAKDECCYRYDERTYAYYSAEDIFGLLLMTLLYRFALFIHALFLTLEKRNATAQLAYG